MASIFNPFAQFRHPHYFPVRILPGDPLITHFTSYKIVLSITPRAFHWLKHRIVPKTTFTPDFAVGIVARRRKPKRNA